MMTRKVIMIKIPARKLTRRKVEKIPLCMKQKQLVYLGRGEWEGIESR